VPGGQEHLGQAPGVGTFAAEGEESDPSVFRRSCDAVEGQLRDLAGSF